MHFRLLFVWAEHVTNYFISNKRDNKYSIELVTMMLLNLWWILNADSEYLTLFQQHLRPVTNTNCTKPVTDTNYTRLVTNKKCTHRFGCVKSRVGWKQTMKCESSFQFLKIRFIMRKWWPLRRPVSAIRFTFCTLKWPISKSQHVINLSLDPAKLDVWKSVR